MTSKSEGDEEPEWTMEEPEWAMPAIGAALRGAALPADDFPVARMALLQR